ncbi:MAG: porin [Acetobacteraceae bacterium]|nr:porin [Acetobacteraceae bacterium]
MTGSAQAAVAEPAAADAACAHKGRGFVQVPGTMTCVKVAGRAVAEADVAGGGHARRMRTGGTVSMDVRSDTTLGPVRGFVRLRVREGREGER